MRFIVTHPGFFKGRPPRYRHVGEMQVAMETPVEIRQMAAEFAPVVYRIEDIGQGLTEFRFHDGSFYRRSTEPVLTLTSSGAISIGLLERDTQFRKYRERCNWRSFSGKGIGSRGTLADVRPLHEWNATEIDDSDTVVFSDAVITLAENFVEIDTTLWERCFEPCLMVHWTPSLDSQYLAARISIDHVGGPSGEIDGADRRKSMHPSPYESLVAHGTKVAHLRSFSGVEPDRAERFLDELASKATDYRISRNEGRRLKVIRPDLASQNFDALELTRSALTHLAALPAMDRAIKHLTSRRSKQRDFYAEDEFNSRAYQLEVTLQDFEAGKVPPEAVIDAMDELRQGLDYASNAFEAKRSISLSAFVPPKYFGDLDNFNVDLEISSIPGHHRSQP
jgi:hypothetical protein